MSPEGSDSLRVFFAVWPPSPVAAALGMARDAAVSEAGGRPMPTASLHCTLSFLGRLDEPTLKAVMAAAGGVEHPGFPLAITTLNYWPHNRITWAGVHDPAGGLASLAARLGDALAGIVQAPALSMPHITLVRSTPAATTATLSATPSWHCTEFVLARTAKEASGARYDLLARWPLAGGGE